MPPDRIPPDARPGPLATSLLTFVAMAAFAANSLLCRLALGAQQIDAASFTSIRLLSGAVALWLISVLRQRSVRPPSTGNGWTALMLFVYAIAFSFAYVSLDVGTGALILFGSVQITMILAAIVAGERPRLWEWGGLLVALAGLVVLVLPGLSAPSPVGAMLMAVAGVAWGVYSLRGRFEAHALAATTGNFLRAAPLALIASAVIPGEFHLTTAGIVLAVCSGAVASGAGYVVWYAALRGLTATRAATVQLTVPVLAALGGVLFLAETVSLRLFLAGIMILGGVAGAILRRARPAAPK